MSFNSYSYISWQPALQSRKPGGARSVSSRSNHNSAFYSNSITFQSSSVCGVCLWHMLMTGGDCRIVVLCRLKKKNILAPSATQKQSGSVINANHRLLIGGGGGIRHRLLLLTTTAKYQNEGRRAPWVNDDMVHVLAVFEK